MYDNWFGASAAEDKVEDIDRLIDLINGRIDWAVIAKELGLSYRVMRNGALITRCVFHGEKTSSLMLYAPPRQFRFYCYGCGMRGHMIKFIRDQFHVESLEDVERVVMEFTRSRSSDPRQLPLPIAHEPQA